eukprot:TRINITY_DN257_c1_g1_i2.p1 TRINITY_DN257_c1_g1~~TRINITY_DN257_c1_g1_i2.p1  ORF type:complete len:653 (+),score=148.68 TRINITY_DN257_c1_g1_i2:200-2158(+)
MVVLRCATCSAMVAVLAMLTIALANAGPSAQHQQGASGSGHRHTRQLHELPDQDSAALRSRRQHSSSHRARWVPVGLRGGASAAATTSTSLPTGDPTLSQDETGAVAEEVLSFATEAAAHNTHRRPCMPAIFRGEGTGGESDCFTRFVSECKLPTRKGTFRLRAYSYEGPTKGLEPLAIVSGDIGDGVDVPVRVHDQCVTSEVLGSMRCDCREQLELSLDYIHRHGGIVIYMQQEGRGIGLANKIAAYSLQDQGLDTVDANRHLGFEDDYRSYEAVEFILRDLGVKSVQLMTNNPFKLKCLKAMGIKVQARIPMLVAPNPHSERYLQAKSRRMSHLLALDDAEGTPVPYGMQPSPVAMTSVAVTEAVTADAAAVAEAVVVEAAAAAVTATAATAVAGDTPVTKLRGGAASDDSSELCADSSELCVDSELCEDDGECETETWAFGRETVVAAIKAVGEGKLVVVTDDEDRENEGDLICAGSCATEDLLAFMIRYTSGVICVSLEGERLDELQIPPMVAVNEDPKATAFAVTVDAKHGTTTGISAKDRSNTLMTLANPDATAADFNRPGHIFPLRYCKGGVLKRGGHTEAALDLARLAGLPPVGVLCEITTADGRDMARLPELREFCKEHGLVLTSIRDMRCYLREKMKAQAHS